MSLDTSPHLFHVYTDPCHRTRTVGIYIYVLDQHGIVYDQPVVLSECQTGVAVEGVVCHNETRADGGLLRLAMDTHGCTSMRMAVAKLLGFDLRPWLCDLSERKLCLPRDLQVPGGLESVVPLNISPKVIREGQDSLLRLVASIHPGRVSAIVVLQ